MGYLDFPEPCNEVTTHGLSSHDEAVEVLSQQDLPAKEVVVESASLVDLVEAVKCSRKDAWDLALFRNAD